MNPSRTAPAALPPLPGPSPASPDQTHFVTTALHQFAESLGNAIDAKDPHTSMHSDEVAEAARALALAMGLTPSQAAVIHVAGHLHDIGKIGVPDSVLKKQGPLTAAEWRAVRRHPEAGAAILEPVAALNRLGVVDMVLHHHERWDGTGYPHGLTGAGIPLGARIISVADSLSAMLQNRPYRAALDIDRACREIERGAGTQFDPGVVAAFRRASGRILRFVSPAECG
ncbi:Cyclic di-GMP phosphodiesterase response regulator RpfG [Pseudodesulfovibrio hydrargyri]|uniref:Cyclic di-GMP phosphodiesterase response regulator RpfG n=1 Tax=Pseudodesulfovibrio hydrargyri TaxID=2125990 RepID=A0A1J5N3J7_9BACT|nr:HD domain-containing phosphohydrolase [Pseudodesulfovibrio hydrargyri]OIQ49400.1 Cyclic di-GMP phosphodiesterase response regulator RpfG [Pseudodesulfovibrio hydrargyri]